MSTIPEEGTDSFRVTYTRQAGKRPKGPRVYYRVRGDFGPDWEIPNNDIDTVTHGIFERVFFVKIDGRYQRAPKPWTTAAVRTAVEHIEDPKERASKARQLGTGTVMKLLGEFTESMRKEAAQREKSPPLSSDEFVSSYVGAKRRVYAAAALSLETKPFDMKKDSRVKVFTKDEYSKGVPRIIQPRSPRFNVMLGRHIKHVEHTIYHAINEVFDASGEHVTVQKGRTHIERGNAIASAWLEFDNPVCVELDAARFDQHLNVPLLQVANHITEQFCIGHGDEGLVELSKLLNAQLENHGVFVNWEGIIRYCVDGCGMSGDMNTSLRNVIVMCAGMFSYLKHLGIRYRYGNDGDDGWLICEQRDLDLIVATVENWFLQLGLTMKIEGIKYTLEEIEFCQGHPVFNEDHGYVLIPNPCKRLYSDLVSTRDLSSRKIFHKWMGAVAGCGLAQTRGVPLLQNHYRWIAKTATPWVPGEGDTFYKHSWWNAQNLPINKGFRSPTHRERTSFFFAFDIKPNIQMQVERYYDQQPAVGWMEPKKMTTHLPPLFRVACPPVQKDRILDGPPLTE